MDILEQTLYWKLLSRKPTNIRRGFDAFPQREFLGTSTSSLYLDTFYWAVIFSAICLLVPIILKIFAREYWESLVENKEKTDKDGKKILVRDTSKRDEYPSVIITLLHHMYVVPLAFFWIYLDFTAKESEYHLIDHTSREALIAPFCLGYFVADTFFYVVPMKSLNMLLHHFLFVALVLSTLFGDGNICKFIPHLLISDSTGILFNICFILRTVGFRDHWLVQLLEILFALFFLLLRSINMPLAFHALFRDFNAETLGLARYVIAPICLLQWHWMALVITKIFNKVAADGKKKK